MKPVDPRGTRLSIKIDSTSNGEYEPIPLSERNVEGNRVALERATKHAKHLGVSRRRFLVSSAGAASTLLAFNEVKRGSRQYGRLFRYSQGCGAGQRSGEDGHARHRVHLRCARALRKPDR